MKEKLKQKLEVMKQNMLLDSDGKPSQVFVYGYWLILNSIFFDTEDELIEFAMKHHDDFGGMEIVEYVGTFEGRSDVIRKINSLGQVTICALTRTSAIEEGYAKYNQTKSEALGRPIWEFEYGDLSSEQAALKKKGVQFQNDIVAQRESFCEYFSDIFDKVQNDRQNESESPLQRKLKDRY